MWQNVFSSTGDESSHVGRVLQLLCRAIFKVPCYISLFMLTYLSNPCWCLLFYPSLPSCSGSVASIHKPDWKAAFFFLVRFGPRLAVYHSTLVGRGSFDNPIIICCMMPFRYSFRFMGPSRLPDIQPQTAFVPVGASCVSVSEKQKKQGQDKYVPPAEDTLVGTGEAGRRLHAPVGLNTIKSVLVAASSSPQHWLKRPRKNTFNVIHAFSFSKRLMLDWKE